MDFAQLDQSKKNLILWGSALYILNKLPHNKTSTFNTLLEGGSFDQFMAFLKTLDANLENNIAAYIKGLLA